MMGNIRYKYYIGIDCGVNTGFAIWNKLERRLMHVDCDKILKIIERVKDWKGVAKGNILVRVEDARLRTWIPYEKNEKAERGKREGAGSVKRDAQIWEDFLKDEGIPYEMVQPKNNKTKTTAAYFKQITGWQGNTNEHARDAAMLVFGF